MALFSVEIIDFDVFEWFLGTRKIVMPESVKNMGSSAF